MLDLGIVILGGFLLLAASALAFKAVVWSLRLVLALVLLPLHILGALLALAGGLLFLPLLVLGLLLGALGLAAGLALVPLLPLAFLLLCVVGLVRLLRPRGARMP